jgi:hypothetical protein
MPADRKTLDTGPVTLRPRWLTLRSAANSLSLLIAALLAVLPALLGAYLIKRYAVNVLLWDEWEVVGLLEHWYTGTWTFTDFWRQHNEHRIVFPRVLLIALWHWTHLDTRAGMWATWVMLSCLAVVLYFLISPIAADHKSALCWFIPISWLVFNWRQWESLLWGFQLCFALMLLSVVCAIYSLTRSAGLDRSYWLAILSAVVGSFSLANGQLIWPIGLGQILGQHYLSRTRGTKHLWGQMGVWSLTGLVVYTLYFRGYHKPGYHPSLLFFFQHPLTAIQYFLVYWGNPLTGVIGGLNTTQVAGGLVLAIGGCTVAILLCGQPLPRAALPCLSFVLFALLSGAMLVMARAGFGLEQAATPRYVSFASLGLIGFFVLAQVVASDARRRTLQGVWMGFLVLGALTSYPQGRGIARSTWAERGEAAFFLRAHTCQPDDKLRRLYPVPDVVRTRVSFVELHHLNVFYRQPRIACPTSQSLGSAVDMAMLTVQPGQTDYALDWINHHPIGSVREWTINSLQEPMITLAGWAVDREAGGPSAGVAINVDGRQDVPAEYGQERLDVALFFDRPSYWHSGFAASLPVEKLGRGRHLLRLKILSADHRQYYSSEQIWVLHIR